MFGKRQMRTQQLFGEEEKITDHQFGENCDKRNRNTSSKRMK